MVNLFTGLIIGIKMKESKLQTHLQENNNESQVHLEKNAIKFSRQCLMVLELLYQGKRLTTLNAPTYGIRSLPRRIKDLRDRNGITIIQDQWLDKNGNPCVGTGEQKEWFIEFKTQKSKQECIAEWRERMNKKPNKQYEQLILSLNT